MFYFILAAVVFVALVLIFRDDHDRRYDQRSGSERQYLAEKQAPRQAPASAPRPEPRTNARKTMETEIAGLRYYCSLVDIGPISGVVRAEPDNAHDPRAQVVIRADGKKLGYIPRYALDEYWNFTGGHLVCPFAGRVNVDSKGYMRADISVALPSTRDFVKEKLSDFVS